MTAAMGRLGSLGSIVRRGLAWWLGELKSALPTWAIALVVGDRRCVHLEKDEAGELRARLTPWSFAPGAIATTALRAETATEKTTLNTIRTAARSRPVVLEAPTDLVLTQTVLVPRAALENLPQAVGFGISTWTPFTDDMLVYYTDIVEIRGEQARIRIRMVPRASLEPLVVEARGAGLLITAIAFGEDIVDHSEPGTPTPKRKGLGERIDLVLFGLTLVLGVAILVTLHLRWADELAELQEKIRIEITQRTRQTSIEQQLSQMEERRKVVLTKRAREPRLAAIVSDLANRLSSDVDVAEFGWGGAQGRVVVMTGEGHGVSEALENSPLFKSGPPSNIGGGQIAFDLGPKVGAR